MKFSQFWKILLYKTSILGGPGPPGYQAPDYIEIVILTTYIFILIHQQKKDRKSTFSCENYKVENSFKYFLLVFT